jgi:hypothetical protein
MWVGTLIMINDRWFFVVYLKRLTIFQMRTIFFFGREVTECTPFQMRCTAEGSWNAILWL